MTSYIYTVIKIKQNITCYDPIYTVPDLPGVDGSVSYQFCQAAEEKERGRAKQDKVHTSEKAERSEHEVLYTRFWRISGNDQIMSPKVE